MEAEREEKDGGDGELSWDGVTATRGLEPRGSHVWLRCLIAADGVDESTSNGVYTALTRVWVYFQT